MIGISSDNNSTSNIAQISHMSKITKELRSGALVE